MGGAGSSGVGGAKTQRGWVCGHIMNRWQSVPGGVNLGRHMVGRSSPSFPAPTQVWT
jgi:hypothetical protein